MSHALVQGLDKLFEIGFTEMDNLKMIGKTQWPQTVTFEQIERHDDDTFIRTSLHCLFENIFVYRPNINAWTTVCVRLLQKGSNPYFFHSSPQSNLLVELVRRVDCFTVDEKALGYWEELVRYASGLFDPMARNNRVCFCSPKGRLLSTLSMIRDRDRLCMRHVEYLTFLLDPALWT